MAETLKFSLVSPERELFHGDVEHVVAPGSDGDFGVLPRHAPVMATLRAGVLRILGPGAEERRIFVNGGFADVTPDGLTVLAEDAVDLADVDAGAIDLQLKTERDALGGRTDAERAAAELRIARLEALRASV